MSNFFSMGFGPRNQFVSIMSALWHLHLNLGFGL
ncbi:hypothetical protein V6Z11_D08G131800 [Gossypium hirsutum]